MKRRTSLGVPIFFPDWLELREVTRSTEGALQHHAFGNLLDVGCGEMPYRAVTSRVSAWVGMDADENSAAQLHGTASAIPSPSGSFDTILCTQVLEHVQEPAQVLNELKRVLAPGGVLILSAPQYWETHEEPNDFFRYTEHGLRHLLLSSGFEILEHRSQGHGVCLAFQAFNLALLHAGEGSRIGRSMVVRVLKLPIYFLSNLFAIALSPVLGNPRDAMNHLFVLRHAPAALREDAKP